VFAASVLVIDLPAGEAARPVVRGWFPVPPARPARTTPAVEALDAAAANVVGESRHTWLSLTGADRYLPDLIAGALRETTGADAGMVLAAQHLTQGSLDGVTAAIRAGPVTELDLMWLFALADDRPAILELRPGELAAMVARHDATADPTARHTGLGGGHALGGAPAGRAAGARPGHRARGDRGADRPAAGAGAGDLVP
jgi:hypothetical protein